MAQTSSLNTPRRTIEISDIRTNDIVVLIVGTTGSGMSNFINKLTGMPVERANSSLESCTMDVRAYVSSRSGKRFVFVDTPGFNSKSHSQDGALGMIADWLRSAYHNSIELTGVIFTYRITDTHVSGTELASLRIASALCGGDAADRVRLVTTMWDDVDVESAKDTENTMKTEQWKSLLDKGARYERFYNTRESAWKIIDSLGNNKKALLLQRERVDIGMPLARTAAGRLLQLGKAQVKPSFPNYPRTPIPMSEIKPADVVILVLGTTGSGMSNFIDKLTGMAPEHEASKLGSCTKIVTPYAYRRDGKRFIFVDTPGLNNTRASKREVLGRIVDWLDKATKKGIQPAGVIYTRRITDEYSFAAELKNFQTVARWCRRPAVAERVRLVTTMWDEADMDSAQGMENAMKDEHWKSLLDAGARYERFYNTRESAWAIVLGLGHTRKIPMSQKSQAEMRKKFEQTAPRKQNLPVKAGARSRKRFAGVRRRLRRLRGLR